MPPRKDPAMVWGLFYRKRLATLDGRLPLFWRRAVADLYNRTHLSGKGTVLPVAVHTKQPEPVR